MEPADYDAVPALGRALPLPAAVPLGPTTLTTRLRVTTTLEVPDRPTLVGSADVVLTGTTTVVEPDELIAPDTATRPAGQRPPPVPQVRVNRHADGRATMDVLLIGRTTAAGGAAVLADVVLRMHDGQERVVGAAYLPTNEETVTLDLGRDPPPPGTFDVVFRSRPDLRPLLFDPPPTERREVVVAIGEIDDGAMAE